MDLYDRLKQARQKASQKASQQVRSREAVNASGAGAAEVEANPRTTDDPVAPGERKSGNSVSLLPTDWEQLDDLVFRRRVIYDQYAGTGAPAATDFLAPGFNVSDITFFDTETTGLSAGAGSVVFLFGHGRLTARGFVVEQLLLADFPGEPAFLGRIQSIFAESRALGSYNGRSFDANVLSTRFLMQGLQPQFPPHFDLLYPSRRLFRSRIGSCSLGSVEEKVLGVARDLDVPGELVPEYYFQFLRSGDFATLAPVVAHHAQDIASLYQLMAWLERIWRLGPGTAAAEPVDHLQLSRLYASRGRTDEAVELLERRRTGAASADELFFLGQLYKRNRKLHQARVVYDEIFDRFRSVRAAIELSKLCEHRLSELDAAEAYLRAAGRLPADERFRREIELRRERIAGKRARAEGKANRIAK